VQFVVVIPARYASSRLPGKALAEIAGKPMVVHVADRARESGAAEVIVATDDGRILDAVGRHGHAAMMTRAEHASGTDRIAEVAVQRGWSGQQIIVNVQGGRAAYCTGADPCRRTTARRSCRCGDRHSLSRDP